MIVVADDITGAAEIAGICLRYGISVSFGIDEIPKEADVRIIATDSRSLSEEEAYRIHKVLAEKINGDNGSESVFKKCDSVIRGYVLTEADVLARTLGKQSILIQPTNPEMGRIIKNNTYYIDGVLLDSTGFSIDPDFPAFTSSVEELLVNRSDKWDTSNSIPYSISDCTSKEELEYIADSANDNTLLCGSAAFFEQVLIRNIDVKINQAETTNHAESKQSKFPGDYLFISGSTHPSGDEFRKNMRQLGCPIVSIDEDLFTKEPDNSKISDFCIKLKEIYTLHHNRLIVYVDYGSQFPDSSPITIKNVISEVAKQLFAILNFHDAFIDGGSTAFDIFKTTELQNFMPQSELSPGVVRLKSLDRDNLHITIKPGSYKWPELF